MVSLAHNLSDIESDVAPQAGMELGKKSMFSSLLPSMRLIVLFQNYLISETPGSTVSFKVNPKLGVVQINVQRSYQYGLGTALCWLDGAKDEGMRIPGYWSMLYNIGR